LRPPRGLFALLAALCALLPDLAAALPFRSYYFRDFSVTFYPLRLFAARELRTGRWPFWNPYIFEGSFVLPVLYPPDLLHALFPGPAAVSWLLTLHLPLAALCAFALARELGAEPPGAFVAGVVYALGGFTLSSLNLYVFLQGLAWAPLLALLLRRAAEGGGRALLLAAGVVGASLTTLAVEFVAQAVVLGGALGLAARIRWDAVRRLGMAVVLGAGLAAIPVSVILGMLRETARGAGFPGEVALANAVHPVSLLQVLLPNLFGSLADPVAAWWGGRFFTKGFPYFLSLYLGPVVLGLAAVGASTLERRVRILILTLAGLALWYALGVHGGLAPLVARLPLSDAFRFPSKAMLLPHLALAVLAGLGFDRLRRGQGWASFATIIAGLGALILVVAALVTVDGPLLASWAGIAADRFRGVAGAVRADCLREGGPALVALLLAGAVLRRSATPRFATGLLAALVVFALARAGVGMNPQTAPSFFDALPEVAALRLHDLDGGRVFSYGVDSSPAFRAFLARGGSHLRLASFFLNRQLLGPYSNVLDRVEEPEATDLTAFAPRPRELGPADYDPRAVAALVPWLRNAAVSRVLSLDPLEHPDLEVLARVPVGAGLSVHAYALRGAWPRAYVACQTVNVPPADAPWRPYTSGFDPAREVALEEVAPAHCQKGAATRVGETAMEERYSVESDGPAVLVVRSSFARGWRASVDGQPARVLRANGKHCAVPLPGGPHEVRLEYRPPGLRAGIALTFLAFLGAAVIWVREKGKGVAT